MPLLPCSSYNAVFLFLEGVAVLSMGLLLLLAATSRSLLTRLDAISVSISAITILIGLFRVWVLVVWNCESAVRRMQMEFAMTGYYNVMLMIVLITAIRMGPAAPYTSMVGHNSDILIVEN